MKVAKLLRSGYLMKVDIANADILNHNMRLSISIHSGHEIFVGRVCKSIGTKYRNNSINDIEDYP